MQKPNIDLVLQTERLILEPVNRHHAKAMMPVLRSAELYKFIPFNPPTLENLQAKYQRWESGISSDETEIQFNWVTRLKENNQYIGDFQVGYIEDKQAYIAYLLAPVFQGKGYAAEGLHAILKLLFEKLSMKSVKAWIDTRNDASISLVKKLGLKQIDFIAKADHFKGHDSDEFVFEITFEEWKIQ